MPEIPGQKSRCWTHVIRELLPTENAECATDDLVRDLITEDYGVVVMSSSLGEEFSIEDSNVKQGYFTKAIVEGLAG